MMSANQITGLGSGSSSVPIASTSTQSRQIASSVTVTSTQSFQLEPGGIQDSIKGSDYQLKLLQLFSLRAYNYKWDFHSWTEDKRAGKFDDVVFQNNVINTKKFTFVQAKQKSSAKFLTFQTFFSDKNFHLYKYFDSFLEVERNFNINYNNLDLKELIICTNNTLPPPKGDLLELLGPTLSLYFKKFGNHDILGNCGKVFRFNEIKEIDNLSVLKQMFLIVELVKLLFENNPATLLVHYAKTFLLDKIFKIVNNSIKFRDEFINPGTPNTKQIREMFEFVIYSGFISIPSSQKNKISSNFWFSFKNMKLKTNFLSTVQSFTDDPNYIDRNITNFLRKFIFVSALEEPSIDKSIDSELLTHFTEPNERNIACLDLDNSIKEWLADIGNNPNNVGTPINSTKIDEIFGKTRMKINELHFKSIKDLAFKDNFPEFAVSHWGLANFLKLNSSNVNDRVLIYEVSKEETFYASVRLYQMDNTILYLTSSHPEKDFEKLVSILKNRNKKFFVLIECTKSIINLLSQVINALNIKSKLIIVCDASCSSHFTAYKKITEGPVLCETLTAESLKKLLEKDIDFQGRSVKLKDIIDVNGCSWSLKSLENLEQLGEPLETPQIYLPRILYRKIHLKKQISTDWDSKKFKDILCLNENDYLLNQKKNSAQVPIHLVDCVYSKEAKEIQNLLKNNSQEFAEKFLWKKSSESIQNLRLYVNENDPVDIKEDELVLDVGHVNIFQGIAGMGKSLFFQHVAYKLKEAFENCWVQNIDLMSFFDKLSLLEEENFKEDDFKGIQNYFFDHFMSFKSNLEKEVFKYLVNEGRIIFLFDGFDEIADPHKDTVITLITALVELSQDNKFFISTRPEWSELLEDKYSQFVYSFYPFSAVDQETYLLAYWKKDATWLPISKSILENLNNSITDKEKLFTGVPLITKLMAEYFSKTVENDDLVTNKVLQDELLSLKFTLFDLLEHFINKKLEIYCCEKLQMSKNHPQTKRLLKSLKENHLKLAYKILFHHYNFDSKTKIPLSENFDEDTKQEMIRCGLVENTNGQLKFIHQTFAEFTVTVDLKANMKELEVLEFIIEVVLVGGGFKLIRSFINNFINNVVISSENKSKIRNKLTGALNVAAKESNTDTFKVLFDILAENIGEGLIQDSLLAKDSDGFNVFYHYLAHCELKTEFLDDLQGKFGMKFITDVLESENGVENLKVISGAALHGKNYLTLVKWIIQKFSDNFDFVKKVLITQDHNGNNILHNSTKKFDEESFLLLLVELKNLQMDLLSELLLMKNSSDQTFLHCLLENLPKDDVDSQNLITKVICWLRINTGVLSNIVLSGDSKKRSLIHHIAWDFKESLPKILKLLQNSLNSYEFLKQMDYLGNSFFNITVGHDNTDVSVVIIEILEWLKQADYNLLKEIVYLKDYHNRTLLHGYCLDSRKKNVAILLKTSIDWFQRNIQNFQLVEFLSQKDDDGCSFFSLIPLKDNDNEATAAIIDTLEWLKRLDEKLLNQIVYWKDNYGRNLIHFICQFGRKRDLPNLLKELVEWLQKNVQNFNSKEILLGKSDDEFLFIDFMAANDSKNEAAAAIIKTLAWLNDLNMLNEVVTWTDSYNQNLLHKICQIGRKKDLPNLLKILVKWLECNLPNFVSDQFLTKKDCDGILFIDLVAFDDNENEASLAIVDILKWLKELNLLDEFVYSKNNYDQNLIYKICQFVNKKRDIPDILKVLIQWLDANVQNFNRSQFLAENDQFGNTFLSLVVTNDTRSEATAALVDILNWLKELDFMLLDEIVFRKNIYGRNLIYFASRHGCKKDLVEFLRVLCNWLEDNLETFDRDAFLFEKDSNGNCLLNFLVLDDPDSDALLVMTEVLQWLKDSNFKFLTELLCNKAKYNRHLVHFFCKKFPKKNVPKLVNNFIGWIKANIPDFNINRILLGRDKFGFSFLNFVISNESSDAFFEILEWLKNLDPILLNELINLKSNDGKNFVSFFCKYCGIEDLTKFLKLLFEWLRLNLPDFELKAHLLQKSEDGNIFLNDVLANHNLKKASQTEDVLNVLKEFDNSIYEDVLSYMKEDSDLILLIPE